MSSTPPTASEPGRFAKRLSQVFRTALIVIPIGVAGNILFTLLVTEPDLLRAVTGLPRGYLLVAVILGLIPWFTGSLRLFLWIRFLGHRVRYKDTFEITLINDLGAAVSPTAVGGGFFKWGALVQRGIPPGVAASLTMLASFEDAIFFSIALPIAVIITASWHHPVFGAVAEQFRVEALPVLAGALLIGVVSWLTARAVLSGSVGRRSQRHGLKLLARVRRKLRRSWSDARSVYALIGKTGKLRLLFTVFLTGIHWSARYTIISALVAFLGAPVQPVLFWLLQWIVFTLATMVPTPGAAGGAEAAFFVIYSPFIPSHLMALATAGWRFFTFYLSLLLAAVLFVALGGARSQRPPIAEEQ